jgi:hypothetical protein
MEKKALSKDELISLIAEFRSEVKKNLAKIDFFNEKIEELTHLLNETPAEVFNAKSEKTRKPYPLSAWDNIVLDVVRDNGKPTTSKEIYDKAMAKATEMGIAMEESKMKSKINQCLVKLSGRRDDLKKIKYGGRGFAYAIQ